MIHDIPMSKKELHAAHTAFYTQQMRLQNRSVEATMISILLNRIIDRVADTIVDNEGNGVYPVPMASEELIAARDAFSVRIERLKSYIEGMHPEVAELPDMRTELTVMTTLHDRISGRFDS